VRVKLTPENVGKLRPREGRAVDIVWDAAPSAPPAFGVRVHESGAAAYVIQYRTAKGTDRRMRLKALGDITLAEAREAARRILGRVAAGEDPAADRRADETAEKLEDLVLAYIDHGKTRKGATRAKKTTGDYRRAWADNIKGSELGRSKPDDVKARDVERFLTRKATDAPVMADRLHALIRSTYRWALRTDRATVDPTVRLDRVIRRRTRDRVLSDAEVKALWTGLDAAVSRPLDEKGPRLSLVQATAARVLLLVGQRLDETLRMKWADLDLSAKTWSIPGPVRKGGKAHVVPLPPAVKKLLEELEELRPAKGKREYVFAGERGASIAANPYRFAEAIRAAAPDVTGWTLHDARRTCASGVARLGASDEVVSRLLGHASGSARGVGDATPIYQRYDRLAEVASALQAWATHVARVVSGKKKGADVIPLARA
jgi:integrase